jgi:DNA-binding MarR family transcriptional regulator
MTSLLDTLERRGLVERHPHPSDRRKILVHVTDEARRIVEQTLPVQHAVITAAVEEVSQADREQLIATLATIWARLQYLAERPLLVPETRRKRRAPAATSKAGPTK